MREKIVAANWKLNGDRSLCGQFAASALTDSAAVPQSAAQIVVCPPVIWLAELAGKLGASAWRAGAQDVAAEASGAYTGEVSAAMLVEAGAEYCLVGHSERRSYYADSPERVARKLVAALEQGLRPVLCVGEDLACREAGGEQAFVAKQLAEALSGSVAEHLSAEQKQRVVIAYEPIWAIGTGVTATAEQAQQMHASIRVALNELGLAADTMPILYGGSVKPANAAELMALPDVDGALVGGASLQLEDFLAIAAAV